MKRQIITNCNVFDGNHEQLKLHSHIIIEDNLVTEISSSDVSAENFDEIIDAGGRIVIPGLVDCHVHVALTGGGSEMECMRADETAVRGAKNAEEMLYRGFTTVRDAGGLVWGIKHCIDTGYTIGPRIFPSHSGIGQTSGHCDNRPGAASMRTLTGYMSPVMDNKIWILADGANEVLKAARDQLFLGASQIKLFLGGGIASVFDPLYTVQYTEEEIRAAVQAAKDYGTYVMAHLYTCESMQRAVRAGVMSLEHTQLMDDETARMIRDNGVWVCPCPAFAEDSMMDFISTEDMQKKYRIVKQGVEQQTELIDKYHLNVVFGTDMATNKYFCEEHQLKDFGTWGRRYGSFKTLQAATGRAYDLFKLSTYRNPYPEGKIGVLEEGSFADLLIVDGNPVRQVDLLTDKNNFRVIMKDGTIYKNTLHNEGV